MEKLIQEFLKEYIEKYNLDIKNEQDIKELKKAIDTIELQECLPFMNKHNIHIATYPKFRKSLLLEFKNQLQKMKSDIQKIQLNELIGLAMEETKSSKEDVYFKQLIKLISKKTVKLNEFEQDKIYEICLDKMMERISKDQIKTSQLKEWTFQYFKKYNMDAELIENVYANYIRKIEKTELDNNIYAREQVLQKRVNRMLTTIYNIDQKVKINNHLLKGKISGYILTNNESSIVAKNKNELAYYLKKGYHFASYQVKQNFLGIKKVQEIPSSEVKKEEKHIWKKAMFASLFAAAIIGSHINNSEKQSNKEVRIESTSNKKIKHQNLDEEMENQIETLMTYTSKRPYQAKVGIKKEQNELSDLEETLNNMPASYAEYGITSDAKIYTNLTDEERNYKEPHYKEGTIKLNSGYVLIDDKGIQHIITDPVTVRELLETGNYNYVGTRAINETSFDSNGKIIGYEGLFSKDGMVLLDNQDTLYDELKAQDKGRVLTK